MLRRPSGSERRKRHWSTSLRPLCYLFFTYIDDASFTFNCSPFLGMLEPRPSDGGVLGPTFQCIVAEQFRRLRVGDRFWHENAPNPSLNTDRTAFNAVMLKEIRKTTFAKIICDNADYIPFISKRVLEQSKKRVKCSALPTVSLEPWVSHY